MRQVSIGEKTKMKKRIVWFAFILLVPLFSQAAELGRIQGQVRKAGKPIEGVDVVLGKLSLSTITDTNGVYFFNTPPQFYGRKSVDGVGS
jgi:hypothetical protein